MTTRLTMIALAALIIIPLALAEKPEQVPNPPAISGKYVGDGANVLGPAYIDLIDGISRKLKEATTAELAVVTVGDLGGIVIEEFAEKVFRRFGIGEKGKDNGLLILLSLADRAIRIEVGYGLEPVVTDAQSARLIDEHALPRFQKGEWGRGLYELAKATAATIAKDQGIAFDVADPAAWPVQIAIPEAKPIPVPLAKETAKPKQGSGLGPIILAGAAAAWGVIGMVLVSRKYRARRAKAGRAKAISSANGVVALLWTGAGAGLIGLAASGSALLSSLLALLSPTAVTVGQGLFRKNLRRRLEDYKLPCSKCGQAMDLTPESDDDALLSVEEAAEERAGGMDYEVWTCPACGNQERLSVSLFKAKECPKCKRRTLKESDTTLVTATTSLGGRVRHDSNCLNPNCGYSHSVERNTPRLSSSGSGSRSGGGGGTSRSSFGGGRSGGGGASRRF